MLDSERSGLWSPALPPPHHSLPFNLCKPPCPPGTGRRHHWLTCWQCRGHLPVFISLKGSVTFDTVGYSLPLKILFPLCIQNTPFSWFSQGLSSCSFWFSFVITSFIPYSFPAAFTTPVLGPQCISDHTFVFRDSILIGFNRHHSREFPGQTTLLV